MMTTIAEGVSDEHRVAEPKAFWRRHTVAIWAVPLGLLVLVWFFGIQPRTVTTVNEAFPTAAPRSAITSGAGNTSTARTASMPIATGTFFRVGEDGSGAVSLVALADGKAVVRLENFQVANGPDLRVVLRGANGAELDLGALKGNVGNQTYDIPAGTDLARYRTAAIYCRVAHVTFIEASLS